MKEIVVRAYAVDILEDLNAFVVGLYDDPEEPEQGLEIQKSLELDEQDVALGMDTYCLVTSSGRTVYGGVSSCIYRAGALSLKLAPEAAKELGGRGFRLLLEIDEVGRSKVREGLKTVFEGREPPELVLE